MTQEGISKQQYNALVAAFIFGLASVAIGLLAILYSYKKVVDLNAEYRQLHASVSALKAESQGPKTNNSIIPPADTVNEPIIQPAEATSETGNNKTAKAPGLENKTPEINKPVKEKQSKAATGKVSSRDVVLTYYQRRADNPGLVATLEALGYRFEEKTMDKNTGFEKTNCIWYGAGVPVSDVRKVAIAMIQSGNPVKGIKRFGPSIKDPSYKRNIIEVGREEKFEKYYTRPMSIYEVEHAKL